MLRLLFHAAWGMGMVETNRLSIHRLRNRRIHNGGKAGSFGKKTADSTRDEVKGHSGIGTTKAVQVMLKRSVG